MATDTGSESEAEPSCSSQSTTRPRSSTWWERLKWVFFPTRVIFLVALVWQRLVASLKHHGRRVCVWRGGDTTWLERVRSLLAVIALLLSVFVATRFALTLLSGLITLLATLAGPSSSSSSPPSSSSSSSPSSSPPSSSSSYGADRGVDAAVARGVGVNAKGEAGGARGGAGPSIYISSPVCNGAPYEPPATCADRLLDGGGGGGEGVEGCERRGGAASGRGSEPAECTRSAEGMECMNNPLECMVDRANKLVFWTENFEAYRDGHRWVWLDDQGYDVDGSGQEKTSAAAREASKGPQKVTIPMSGLALGAPHNVTVSRGSVDRRCIHPLRKDPLIHWPRLVRGAPRRIAH